VLGAGTTARRSSRPFDVSAIRGTLERLTPSLLSTDDRSNRPSRDIDRITPALIRLALPAVGHMLLITAVFFVDRLLLGRFSQGALASLQLSAILIWTIYAVLTSFTAGTLAVVARAIGRGDRESAADAVSVSFAMAAFIGVIAGLALFLGGRSLVATLFPLTDPAVMSDSVTYLRIVAPTLPFMFIEAALAAGLQGAGDTRAPLRAAAVGNIANLALSATLIFGLFAAPRLGITGAAIGCAAANLLQAAFLVRHTSSRTTSLSLRVPSRSRSRVALRALIHISLPALMEKVIYHAGYLAFVGVIALLGTSAMAANQALISIESIAFLTADGIGIAAAALVGQELGANRPHVAKQVGLTAAVISTLTLAVFAMGYLAFPRVLLSMFGSFDASAIQALVVLAAAQPFMAIATALRMSLRGAGATGQVLRITLIGTLVRLPATYLFAVVLDLGIVGVWIGSTTDWIVQSLLCLHVFLRGNWQRIGAPRTKS
jgi:multidrug resistance protein, MATE family